MTLGFDELMQDDSDPIIPFGKHKGNYASSIDVCYLNWLVGEKWFCEKFAELKLQIEEHLKNRQERIKK